MTTLNLPVLHLLGESAVRSLALALLVVAALRLLRVRNASIEKHAWTGVLLLAIAMPLLVALHIPRFSVPAIWATPQVTIAPTARLRTATVHVRTVSYAPQLARTLAEDAVPPISIAVPEPAALQGSPIHHAPFPWTLFGVLIYALVSLVLLGRVVIGLVLAARLWSRAECFSTDQTSLRVRLTAELDSPVTMGLAILLPLEAVDWDTTTLRSTLAHEAAHVRSGDFYLQLACSLHLAVFWISPLAWWLPAQLSQLSETICDRAALEVTGDGLRYAQLLLRLATSSRTPAGMLAMAQSAGLRDRVERLIADPQLSRAFRHRRGQAAGALLLVSIAAVGSAATVRILAPESAVLAAPKAPAAPIAPQAAAPPQAPAAPAPPTAVAPSATPADSIPGPSHEANPSVPTPVVAPAPGDLPEPVAAPAPQAAPAAPLPPPAPEEADSDVWISTGGATGRSFAVLSGDGNATFSFSGDAGKHQGEWRQLRHQHPGGAIWFERDGKSYVIEDPALVKQARQAYEPVQELGRKQGELGEKQGKLGDEQGHLGELQGVLGEKQGEWGEHQAEFAEKFDFKMPEGFDKAAETLAESASRLTLEGDSLTAAQRAELEAQQKQAQANFDKVMAEFKAHQSQREAWEKQMRELGEQMRKQMEPMVKQMAELGAKQGELGRQQALLGRQQAMLGRQQREASREADRKVQQLIDQALRDGKAHPAQ